MSRLHFAVVERSFLAILAGFATMAVLVTLATLAISKSFPSLVGDPARPPRGYMLLNLAYSAMFAAVGGYVTAWIAKPDPLPNTLMLALVVLTISALSAIQLRGEQPIAYQFSLLVITPIAALGGGLLRMHAVGYRW
jgi:hypothetical protein